MTTVRIPLFGSIESRDYKSFFDGVTADTMIKWDQGGTDVQFDILTDTVNGKKVGYFYPRENFATSNVPSTVSADGGTAIHCWTGSGNAIISAFGPTNSNIYNSQTNLGAVTGQANFITEAVVSDVSNLLITTTSNKGYYYPVGGSLTEITTTGFPPKQIPALNITGPLVQMDGFTFVMCTNGQIWNSDLNSVSAWTAASVQYTTAQQKPDAGVGLARYQNAIVAFSSSSTEFFFNAGNATNSPLSPEQNYINYGCANQYAYCTLGDTVAFYSTNQGYGIYVLEGRGAKKISTAPIDRILAGIDASTVRLNPFVSFGKLFLLVGVAPSPGQLAYDVMSQTWQLWIFTGNQVTQSDIVPSSSTASSVYVGPSVRAYYEASSTGKTGTFLTGKFDANNSKRKFASSLRVVGAMGSNTATTVSISYSDDDYQTFSAVRTVDINTYERPSLFRLGSFRDRAFKVTATNDNSDRIVRIAALEMDYEQGT